MPTDQPLEDRRRAEHFGAIAEEYDAARPDYAAELLDIVGAGPGVRALDVGCGTGRLSAQLAGAGCQVLGVEVDARMAAVARRHGVAVEVARFENWDAAGRTFDLLVSGSAWHWVDPVAGAARAAAVVRSGGRFAALWNEWRHDAEALQVMLAAYRRHAPAMRSFALGFDGLPTPDDDPAAAALAAGPWEGVRPGLRTVVHRTRHFTPVEWTALLATFSDHRALPEHTRTALLADLVGGLAGLGATFPVTIGTSALLATRR